MPATQTLTVRRAELADAEQIAQIHVSAWRSAYRGVIGQEFLDAMDVAQRTVTWREHITAGAVQITVCELDGRLLGWVTTNASRDEDATPDTGEIGGLYTPPEAWGTGAGGRLIEHALQALAAAGMTGVTLWVLVANPRARAFYEKHGFSAEGDSKPHEPYGVDVIRYRRAF